MSSSVDRLRAFREERGWTQREVAEHVQRLAWMTRGDRVGVNADMVAKWERGAKGVSSYYCALLALLFGVDVNLLGGKESERRRIALDTEPIALDIVDLLDRLGPLPERVHATLVSIVDGRAGQCRAVDRMTRWPPVDEPEIRAPVDVRSWESLTDRYRSEYHNATPTALLGVSVAHLAGVAREISRCSAETERRRLLHNHAVTAVLAGRLSFFDLGETVSARGHYATAIESAREAEDARQTAAALGHLAFVPAAQGRRLAAQDYLDGAHTALDAMPHSLIRSWLHAVEAELAAASGDDTGALLSIERARTALSSNTEAAPTPAWFDYYDTTRLAGFAGYVHLCAGRWDEARGEFQRALELPVAAVKQRSVVMTDLAASHIHSGDLDEACRLATIALDELQLSGYATGDERLRALADIVRPHARALAPARDFLARLSRSNSGGTST